MRLDHWIKNAFMLPGVALGIVFSEKPSIQVIDPTSVQSLFLSFAALCIASSANYVINEWLDRGFDKIHPMKSHRIATHFEFRQSIILIQYLLLVVLTVLLATVLSRTVALFLGALLVMGVLYNVKPIRLKDRFYVDVISESVNNPIRLAIGWHCIAPSEPVPASAFLSFWGIGIFLMSLKRYAEMRLITDHGLLSAYRKSFARWTPDLLLSFAFFGALLAQSFGGVLLGRRNLDYILLFPVFYLLFLEYFNVSLKLDRAAIAPEKLMRMRKLQTLSLVAGFLFIVLTFTDGRVLTHWVPVFDA
jgi:decaprenyl-phosphate phosphoribosyltransferase